jgi:hypothetical protein
LKYTEEELEELEKRTVDVYVPWGHGVQFPDGSWMSSLSCDHFHGHMDYGFCALCPKTGYNFNPDKFWGMSGYKVPRRSSVHHKDPPEAGQLLKKTALSPTSSPAMRSIATSGRAWLNLRASEPSRPKSRWTRLTGPTPS